MNQAADNEIWAPNYWVMNPTPTSQMGKSLMNKKRINRWFNLKQNADDADGVDNFFHGLENLPNPPLKGSYQSIHLYHHWKILFIR